VIPKQDTKTNITEGVMLPVFFIRPSSANYLRKNRLGNILLQSIRRSIDSSRTKTEKFIRKFWPRDSGNLISNALMFLSRNRWYRLFDPHFVEIGSDLEYAKWVFSMTERFRLKHRRRPMWQNPNTFAIEDEIVEKTAGYYKFIFKQELKKELNSAGLGWMFGKGRMPKAPVVKTAKRSRKIQKYYLRQKPIAFR